MNIFVLDKSPAKIPAHYCNIHVNKMLLETCQLLSTTVRLLVGRETIIISPYTSKKYVVWLLPDESCTFNPDTDKLMLSSGLYKQTHVNHPCSKWARHSSGNYFWLLDLAYHLNEEFMNRRGKKHSCGRVVRLLSTRPIIEAFDKHLLTPWPQCMPDEYKIPTGVLYSIVARSAYLNEFDLVVMAYRRYYASKLRDFRQRGLA